MNSDHHSSISAAPQSWHRNTLCQPSFKESSSKRVFPNLGRITEPIQGLIQLSQDMTASSDFTRKADVHMPRDAAVQEGSLDICDGQGSVSRTAREVAEDALDTRQPRSSREEFRIWADGELLCTQPRFDPWILGITFVDYYPLRA